MPVDPACSGKTDIPSQTPYTPSIQVVGARETQQGASFPDGPYSSVSRTRRTLPRHESLRFHILLAETVRSSLVGGWAIPWDCTNEHAEPRQQKVASLDRCRRLPNHRLSESCRLAANLALHVDPDSIYQDSTTVHTG